MHRPKSLNALNVRDHKILTEQIHCLCNNVIFRLSAARNQSTNDQREQTLLLDTSQLALTQTQLWAEGSYLHYVTRRLEENNVSVL